MEHNPRSNSIIIRRSKVLRPSEDVVTMLGMKAMMEDLGMTTKIKVITDATAAIGIAMRKGLGPVRHIETNTLWVQEKVYRKEIQIEKVGGKQNIADAMTKPVDAKDLAVHVAGINLEVRRKTQET